MYFDNCFFSPRYTAMDIIMANKPVEKAPQKNDGLMSHMWQTKDQYQEEMDRMCGRFIEIVKIISNHN
jgi:hypothetical protein